MNTVGLTGGIGSGKTTVAEVFKKLGIAVYNSDTQAKKLMNNNPEIINKLKMIFGYGIYDSKNQLDKKKFADLIFNDKNKLNTVNSIIHPAVKKHFEIWASKQNSPYIIKETAILFESGIYKNVKKIITVTAPINTRIERVIKRDKTTKEKILQRIKNQIDDNYKIKHSDFIIRNDEYNMILP
ncbi:MAG: dephospho-CoA kinase, partial [Chlorobi bacterium]|nr:dephospho-CoA kinase [Chlorobiota bacterium]